MFEDILGKEDAISRWFEDGIYYAPYIPLGVTIWGQKPLKIIEEEIENELTIDCNFQI